MSATMRSWDGPRALLARWRVVLAGVGLASLVTDALVVALRTHPGTVTALEGTFAASTTAGARGIVQLPGRVALPGVSAATPIVVDVPVHLPEGATAWGLSIGDPTYAVAATWDGVPITPVDGSSTRPGNAFLAAIPASAPGAHHLEVEVRGLWHVRALEGALFVGPLSELRSFHARSEFRRVVLSATLFSTGILWLALAVGNRKRGEFAWLGLYSAALSAQFFAWSDAWGLAFNDLQARLSVRETASTAATAFALAFVHELLADGARRVPSRVTTGGLRLIRGFLVLSVVTYLVGVCLPLHQRLDLLGPLNEALDVASVFVGGAGLLQAARVGVPSARWVFSAGLPVMLSVIMISGLHAGPPPEWVLPGAALTVMGVTVVLLHRHAALSGRYEHLFERARDAVLVTRRDGSVVEANPSARMLLGAEHPLGEVVSDESRTSMSDHLAPGPEGRRAEISVGRRQLESLAVDLSDSEVLLVVRDVSGRPEAERSLRNVARMETVGLLASGVAHDFNNALVGLLAHVEDLEGAAGDPMARTRLARVNEAILRTAKMSRRIVEMVRSGPVAPTPVDVGAIVRETLGWTRGIVAAHLTLDVQVAPGLPLIVARRHDLEQLVLNLVVNAASVTPRGGAVRVTVAVAGGALELAVEDEGPGVPPELREKIWEPFFTTRPTGSGIGLTVVARTVRDLGGVVEVQDRVGSGGAVPGAEGVPPSATPPPVGAAPVVRGARFVVRLPLREGGPSKGAPAREQVRVVVVARSVHDARVVATLLLERGFAVEVAPGVPEALAAARNADVLLIHLDVPAIDPLEVAASARVALPGVHVIFLGGPPGGMSRVGDVPCVPAPCDGEVLAAAVRAELFSEATARNMPR